MATETGKMSFAKVAASGTKKNVPAAIVSSQNAAGIVDGSKSRPENATTTSNNASLEYEAGSPAESKEPKIEDAVTKGVQALKITSSLSTTPGLVLDKAALSNSARKGSDSNTAQTTPSSDEVSQKADSNSELGTKPPSLDGKSITSGTTFNALDEKESLRPDDSASVKAAADEDDAFSIRGSLLVNSRFGSDVAARGQRMQIGDMPPRIVPPASQEPVVSGVVTPRSSSPEQQPVTEARVQLATSTAPPAGLNVQNPDEKLLDAMQSQKDRLFLLRLENEVVDFVQNSKEPFMDLPPSNSFCRMLTHKLADYYHMTHSFEAVAGSVRIYRTPFCRVPPPLASFVPANTPSSSTPPPVVQPRKIMRRGEEFDVLSSSGPSKPTSEVDSDSKDKGHPTKEKMSREEREEAYNKARERIFGMPTEASTPENDDSTGISRASSVSAKDKANIGKKNKVGKQRRDDSEGFDSRSQYTPFYHHPQQPTWVPPQFYNGAPMPMHPQETAQVQQQPTMPQPAPHFAAMQAPIAYGASPMAFPPAMPNNGLVPPAGGLPHQYPPQPVLPRHPAQGAQPPYTYPPAQQPPNVVPPQQWQQQQTPPQQQGPPYNASAYSPAQARAAPPPGPSPGQPGMSYAFGQLPANFSPNDPKTQHPIPGSYAGNYGRHGFNPKTQSFVPGTGPIAIPVPGPQAGYGMNGAHVQMGMGPGQAVVGHSPAQPQNGSPYNTGGYQQQGLSTSPYGGSATSSGYGMIRQGSSSSTSAYPLAPTRPSVAAYHDPYGNVPHGQPHIGVPQVAPPLPHGHHSTHGHPHLPPHGPASGPLNGLQYGAPRGPPQHHNKTVNTHPPLGPKKLQQNGPQGSKGPGQSYSNLPHYGNPATLPQKPTTT